ncbi:NAD-dependent protein deacylase sirtuin-5, mitochondrial [Bagarius yarrelli]|uniref:NAD-dependent protein deacylase sirtuin-5, mitochondrial n=1 Tax=Bagarius yarrelli TaxID=175774 RepID=A0A556V114_BAGYA|nr:NAD-dependent protein deacylase sirtuin-5, mitochondrial [Bagarius yarrelli]
MATGQEKRYTSAIAERDGRLGEVRRVALGSRSPDRRALRRRCRHRGARRVDTDGGGGGGRGGGGGDGGGRGGRREGSGESTQRKREEKRRKRGNVCLRRNPLEMLIRQLVQRFSLRQVECGNQITVLRALSVQPQPNSDFAEFREIFSKAKHVAIITGAGLSAESGLPTFRAASGHWRKWKTQDLATPQAFSRNSSRVWEFYHYWRELALKAKPSAAHVGHRGVDPDPNCTEADIPVKDLPRCDERGCDGLLRPDVIWFGETLDSHVLTKVEKELDACDLCLLIGTASVVFPAAMFAPQVASRGVPVAEFNIRPRSSTSRFTPNPETILDPKTSLILKRALSTKQALTLKPALSLRSR